MDGNGRVARLLSPAVLKELEIGSELWSVSRGLARNVARYKEPPTSPHVENGRGEVR